MDRKKSLKRFARPAVAGFALIATAVPAVAPTHAQTSIGTSEAAMHEAIRDFATCVVSKNRALASQYVLDRSSLDFESRYEPLLDNACVRQTAGPVDEEALKKASETMRFALAEALLGAEIDRIDPTALTQAQQLPVPRVVAARYEPEVGKPYSLDELNALNEQRRKDEAAVVMYRFGECVVRTNPVGARAILQAAPDSSAEMKAVQAHMPALSNCVERGAQFRLDRAQLRGALALAYYTLAHAPVAQQ